MNTDERKEEAKRHLLDYMQTYLTADRAAGNNMFKCPFCGSGEHGNKGTRNGALSYKAAGGKYPVPVFKCFACEASGDLITLIQQVEGLNDADAIKRACDLYAPDYSGDRNEEGYKRHLKEKAKAEAQAAQPPRAKEEHPELVKNIEQGVKAFPGSKAAYYMNARGFDERILTAFQIGNDEATGGVIIPYPGQDYYIIRHPGKKENKYYKPSGISEPLFIAGDIDTADTVYFCEGQLDALSLIQAGAPCAVAIGGAGVNKLEELKVNALCIVIGDRDDESKRNEKTGETPGEHTAKSIIEKLKEKGLEGLGFFPPAGTGYKDINDILKDDPARLAELVEEWKERAINSIKARKEEARQKEEAKSAGAFLGDWLEEMKANAARPVVKTCFDRLDRTLDGGLYPGLYTIGAVSSLGKTTLILQTADNIAAQGHDVLFFSLEMSKSELIARSISRLTFEEATERECERTAKTTRAIMSRYTDIQNYDRDLSVMNAALDKYRAYAGNLYFVHGLGNVTVETIRDRTEEHIKATGKTPIIIIDYLQTLAPIDPKATPTDKQNTDKNVLELRRLSRDNNLIIIAISSFNRENYKDTAGLTSFKESGAIEYGSDVLLGLEAYGAGVTLKTLSDIEEAKKEYPRKVELKVLKNRNGATGDRVSFDYYTKFNRFVDVDQRPKPEKDNDSKKGKGKSKGKDADDGVLDWNDKINDEDIPFYQPEMI